MILAAPFAALTLYLKPPYCFIALALYYFFAETWFAILFTVIVEIVEPEVRASCIALFLFCMNQVGGNLPVIITPIKSFLDDYRLSLALIWPGFLCVSALLFLLSSSSRRPSQVKTPLPPSSLPPTQSPPSLS